MDELAIRMRSLTNDLHRAHENYATGRLKDETRPKLEAALEKRLEAIEGEVHARYLKSVASGVQHEPWKRRMN